MPIKVTPPIEKKFFLTETDKAFGCEGDPTYVTIVQATQGAMNERDDMFAEFKRTYEKNGNIVVTQHLSFGNMQSKEVHLTFRDCNIQKEDGTPMFVFTNGVISESAFLSAWNKLPRLVAEEIHSKVLEMNPSWSGVGETSEAGE